MSDQKLNAQQASVDFYYHYNNLLLCAFGLQFALEKSPADIAERYSKVSSFLQRSGPRLTRFLVPQIGRAHV